MANDTTPGWPKFDPVDLVGDALAREHKDIDLSKLNRTFQNILGELQELHAGSIAGSRTSGGSASGLFFLHANRPNADSAPLGTFGAETDRGVVFQVQLGGVSQVWRYVSGTMSAAYASLPTDLGVNDAGFEFRATDTYQEYRWSGTAWVEVTDGNLLQIAYASADLTLVQNTLHDVTGATITLTRPGRHLITGVFLFVYSSALDGALRGYLTADGTAQAQAAIYQVPAATALATVCQQWSYVAGAAGKIVKLQADKSGTGGGSKVSLTHTSISALWVGP